MTAKTFTPLYTQVERILGKGYRVETNVAGGIEIKDRRGWFGWLWGKQVGYLDRKTPQAVTLFDKTLADKVAAGLPGVEVIFLDAE